MTSASTRFDAPLRGRAQYFVSFSYQAQDGRKRASVNSVRRAW
jgi:hypothetical protein